MMRVAMLLPLLALGLLVAFTFWLERLVQSDEGGRGRAPDNEPDVIIERFSASTMGKDGSLRFVLSAERMSHVPAGDTARLEKVSLQANAPDQPRINASAKGGMVSDGGDRVVMEGDVVVTAEATSKAPAWRLTAERLVVEPQKHLATSDSAVQFESRDMTMSAAKLALNTQTRVLNLTDIKAVYQNPRQN